MATTVGAMDREHAVREMVRRGRGIVRAGYAQQIAQAFGQDVHKMGLVFEAAQTGIDWSARAEIWETGQAVAISTLAQALCQELGVSLVKFDTGYSGMGRRSEALTAQAAISLDLYFGLAEHSACDLCGSYDRGSTGPLCWRCELNVWRPYDSAVIEFPARSGEMEYRADELLGYSRAFPTREAAQEFAALMCRAQEELQTMYPRLRLNA